MADKDTNVPNKTDFLRIQKRCKKKLLPRLRCGVDRYETDACALQSQDANEASESWDDLKRGCPLVPIPEGHGELVDIKDVKSAKFHIEGRAEMYSAYNIGWNDALDAVCMNAPSIVPAEGVTDDA